MKEIRCVIGANYGDEGKGMTSRFFALNAIEEHKEPITIFYNGTAQRGHTVDFNKKVRYIFHHFGAATFEQVPTYYAKTFLVHPMEYKREREDLWNNYRVNAPISYCDPECSIITPFDMLFDKLRSIVSGEYGTCAYGSWCANDRMRTGLDLRIKDIQLINDRDYYEEQRKVLDNFLDSVINYILLKVAEKNIDLDKYPDYKNLFNKLDKMKMRFISDVRYFISWNKIRKFHDIYYKFDTLIFEGAQGLGLSYTGDDAAYTTTSYTGSDNILNIIQSEITKDDDLEVCYVSRTYFTRHGDGEFKECAKEEIGDSIKEDITNVFNVNQGNFKYGKFAIQEHFDRIINDFNKWLVLDKNFYIKLSHAFTHMNEYNEDYFILIGDYISDNPFEMRKNDGRNNHPIIDKLAGLRN